MGETESKEPQKYVLKRADRIDEIQNLINEFYEKGYRVRELRTPVTQGEYINNVTYVALFELDIEDKYENVIELKDVPSGNVTEHLANGWIIASASISAKFVRMVKRREVK